jgi:hypothetical protein
LNILLKSIKNKLFNIFSKYIKKTIKSNRKYYMKLFNKKKLKKLINSLAIILYYNNLNKKNDLFVINTILFNINIKCININNNKVILTKNN